jgi:osmotically-inducible protein OsmY
MLSAANAVRVGLSAMCRHGHAGCTEGNFIKGDSMANHNHNGGRNIAIPDENRPSWRPQDAQAPNSRSRTNEDDHDYRSWRDRNYRDDDRHAADRDPRRWEGGRGSEVGYDDRDMSRSTERYGQGQSGYASGRYGDDRSQHMQNRNEMVPSPGSFEDRHHDLGVDDRFTGRGSPGYWQDRGGYDPERYGAQGGYGGGRGFEAERFGSWRGQRGGAEWRGGASEWRGYDPGGYDPRMGRGYDSRGGHDQSLGGRGGYDQRMGYQGSPSYGGQSMGYQGGSYGRTYGPSQQATQEEAQRHGGTEPHVHRGTGPHRGKGPQGYQRSDERIRELVCEALADDDQIDASQIQVSVKDGEVTLSGTVDDRRTRREAEDCVATVSGVRDIQVQLRVKGDRQQMNAEQAAMSPPASRDSSSGQTGSGRNESAGQDKKYRA